MARHDDVQSFDPEGGDLGGDLIALRSAVDEDRGALRRGEQGGVALSDVEEPDREDRRADRCRARRPTRKRGGHATAIAVAIRGGFQPVRIQTIDRRDDRGAPDEDQRSALGRQVADRSLAEMVRDELQASA